MSKEWFFICFEGHFDWSFALSLIKYYLVIKICIILSLNIIILYLHSIINSDNYTEFIFNFIMLTL